jgi:methylated-DNA-[protein]-cysteine S-methyltransferase
MTLYYDHVVTPFGDAAAVVDEDDAVVEFTFLNGVMQNLYAHDAGAVRSPERLAPVKAQVEAFFLRRRSEFTLNLKPRGTPFQQKVWSALCDIPFGATLSYQELARRIGDEKAMRAVGAANGRNPIALIIPCHRVIGKSGQLTGYGGGLPLKRALLDFEAQAAEPRLL